MECPIINSKSSLAKNLSLLAIDNIEKGIKKKINLIWLEAAGCSGNIISLLNAENPDILFLLNSMVNLKYESSIMNAQGDTAYEEFLKTLDTDYILCVEGAIATRDDGKYNIIASYKGEEITGAKAAKLAAKNAKYIISVGTCSSFGGISASSVNESGCKSLGGFLEMSVIKLPGCPCHPSWVIGTLAALINFDKIELDEKNRPKMFYDISIHDSCTRRSYFEKGIFAKSLSEKGCLFKLGCRGPVTKADCPRRKWNGYLNWPIGDGATCIGCTQEHFPDGMEPFVRY